METKICKSCGVQKKITCFEYRSDRNSYRSICKECKNAQKRKYYSLHREELLAKKRERYNKNPKYKEYRLKSERKLKTKINDKSEPQDIKIKLKKQLKRALDKSFTRKELKRQKTYEELLCCSIDEAVDYLINGYEKKYKKNLTISDEVDIDHILTLWSSYKQESIEKLCCYRNLRLLTKRDNHNRKYKITKEDLQQITEFLDFYRRYNEEKSQKK